MSKVDTRASYLCINKKGKTMSKEVENIIANIAEIENLILDLELEFTSAEQD